MTQSLNQMHSRKEFFIYKKSRSTYVRLRYQVAKLSKHRRQPLDELATSDLRLRLGSVDDVRQGEGGYTRGVGRDLKSRRVVTPADKSPVKWKEFREDDPWRPWNTYLTRLNLVNVRT